MRKYMIGIIIGAFLSISTSVFAESLVGQKISEIMPLFIDGKRADKDLIVVNGTSYAPMRAASDLFGYTIKYVPETREVQMKKDISRTVHYVKIKSVTNTYSKEANDGDYVLINNEIYVPASVLGSDNFNYDPTTKTLTGKIGNIDIKGDQNSDPSKGDPIIFIDASPYVKISSVGLKGTFNNGELIIDK